MRWHLTQLDHSCVLLTLEGYGLSVEVFPLGGTYAIARWGTVVFELHLGIA